MKKFVFSVAILATSFAFGQITLEHSYSGEYLKAYTNSTETFYYSSGDITGNVKIYNSNYTYISNLTL